MDHSFRPLISNQNIDLYVHLRVLDIASGNVIFGRDSIVWHDMIFFLLGSNNTSHPLHYISLDGYFYNKSQDIWSLIIFCAFYDILLGFFLGSSWGYIFF